MRRLWLIFAQAVTVSVAVLFVVQTLKPEWLDRRPGARSSVTAIQEAAPAGEPRRISSYADVAKKTVPAVVHIFTSQEVRSRNPFAGDPLFRHFFGDQTQRQSGLGSGVIVSADGYILTNYHVIEAADEIEVASNDGRKYRAKIVGADPETDLAVLKIPPGDTRLPVITFAPPDSLRVGDVVLAIGNPFGVGQTVTSGIVSGLNRNRLGINTFENFIQTDAAINPGNSGGALVDSTGLLVGINSAIYSQSGGSMGLGFAIPVSLARNVMEQIIRTGSVTRGWIGVEMQEITPELADSFRLNANSGALVSGILRGSPADRAGMRPGDALVAINGKEIPDAQAMLEMIATLSPGQTAKLRIRRDGRDIELAVNVAKRPKPIRE
jgi:Do/DeqQ family serine protease